MGKASAPFIEAVDGGTGLTDRDVAAEWAGIAMNLIRRVWRGEVRLWLTYWVLGVGGNVAFVAALVPLLLAAAFDRLIGAWAWLAYLASLGWFVFVFGAIWRSAGRYPGPRLWAALARLGVALGIIRMAAEAAVLVALTRGG